MPSAAAASRLAPAASSTRSTRMLPVIAAHARGVNPWLSAASRQHAGAAAAPGAASSAVSPSPPAAAAAAPPPCWRTAAWMSSSAAAACLWMTEEWRGVRPRPRPSVRASAPPPAAASSAASTSTSPLLAASCSRSSCSSAAATSHRAPPPPAGSSCSSHATRGATPACTAAASTTLPAGPRRSRPRASSACRTSSWPAAASTRGRIESYLRGPEPDGRRGDKQAPQGNVKGCMQQAEGLAVHPPVPSRPRFAQRQGPAGSPRAAHSAKERRKGSATSSLPSVSPANAACCSGACEARQCSSASCAAPGSSPVGCSGQSA